jgi:hypothetical protein
MDQEMQTDRRRVLDALSLPAIAPASDKSTIAIARRTGLDVSRVSEILVSLAELRPRVIRRVDGRGRGYWVALEASRALLDPCLGTVPIELQDVAAKGLRGGSRARASFRRSLVVPVDLLAE